MCIRDRSGRTLLWQGSLTVEQAGGIFPDQRTDRKIRRNIPQGSFLRKLCSTSGGCCTWNAVNICISLLPEPFHGGLRQRSLVLSAVSRNSWAGKFSGSNHQNTSFQSKFLFSSRYLRFPKITSYCDFTRKQSRQNIQNMIFHIVLWIWVISEHTFENDAGRWALLWRICPNFPA